MTTLREMMEWEVNGFEKLGLPRATNLRAAILDHGREYKLNREASHPTGYLRDCFKNAALAALYGWEDGNDYTYCEGVAVKSGIPVEHAWVVNAAGEAIEVTWRDGTTECGFCEEGERELDEDDEGYDEDDEETWRGTCFWCEGSGISPTGEHDTLENAEYIGIEVDNDTLAKLIMKHRVYGVLNDTDDMATILAAREREAA